jgi:hypothetical protein
MQVDDVKRKYLLWGALLAWPPFLLLFLILAVTVIGEIAEQKATGMGAVAGGVSEAFTLYALGLTVVSQAAAVVLLGRSVSKEHAGRAFLAALSLGASLLVLAFLGLFVGMVILR